MPKTISLYREELPYAVNEEIKTLRTNIRFCGDDKRVLFLTSTVADEGKTTIALNLARSFAQLGMQVLLIDADLRKSSLFRKYAKDTGAVYGLSHYLTRQCSANDVLFDVENEGFSVIFSGAVPPNPAEILANERMSELIESARKYFDYIIVDCAPIGMVVDAAIVAPNCDGGVMVVSSGKVRRKFAQEALNKLNGTGVPMLGAILNKVDRRGGRYYSYSQKYYGEKRHGRA